MGDVDRSFSRGRDPGRGTSRRRDTLTVLVPRHAPRGEKGPAPGPIAAGPDTHGRALSFSNHTRHVSSISRSRVTSRRSRRGGACYGTVWRETGGQWIEPRSWRRAHEHRRSVAVHGVARSAVAWSGVAENRVAGLRGSDRRRAGGLQRGRFEFGGAQRG